MVWYICLCLYHTQEIPHSLLSSLYKKLTNAFSISLHNGTNEQIQKPETTNSKASTLFRLKLQKHLKPGGTVLHTKLSGWHYGNVWTPITSENK